jgi:small conductance mechanosensitive channel
MFDQLASLPWYDLVLLWITTYGVKILLALVLFRVATHRSKYLFGIIKIALQKLDLDMSAITFLMSFIRILFYIVIIVTIASMMGIQMTTFIAILWAAWLAIGLSLQASLANIAGGIIIMTFKPYQIWDFVKIKEEMGTVVDITIFMTQLRTTDGKKAVIPNGKIVSDTIENYSAEHFRRVDMRVAISYSADIKEARAVLLAPMQSSELILQDPVPQVLVEELRDNSVIMLLRCFVIPDNYVTVLYELPELVKYALDDWDIAIPSSQKLVQPKK